MITERERSRYIYIVASDGKFSSTVGSLGSKKVNERILCKKLIKADEKLNMNCVMNMKSY